jgi:uncharacterized membrane protein YgcG
MSLHRAAICLGFWVFLGAGCDLSAPGEGAAAVRGELALAEYPGLRAPVIVAHGADGSYVSATVAADGSFRIAIPADAPYRVSIAQLSAQGTLVIVAHIQLSNDAYWGRFEHNAEVDLGAIRPRAGQPRPYDDAYDSYAYDADDRDACVPTAGDAELPYDVKLEVGDSFRLSDAFAEKGPLPAAIVSVTLEGGTWRLSELRADSTFVVTEADCEHEGNRDVGRDRIYVTWQNADGSRETDHLDLRYCESSSGSSGSGSSGSGSSGSGSGGKDSDYAQDDAGCRPPPGETPPVCVPPAPPVSTCDEADLRHVTPLPKAPPHAESSCITVDDPPPGQGTASGLDPL